MKLTAFIKKRGLQILSLTISFQMLFVSPGVGSIQIVSGMVESIRPKGDGYEMTVKHGNQAEVYRVTPATVIEAVVPPAGFQGAQDAPPLSAGAQKGVKGIKDPFGGMSDGAKKALGLPNIPNVPNVPSIPDTSSIPGKQQMQDLKMIDEVPGKRQPAGAGEPSAGGALPARKPPPDLPEMPPVSEMLGPELPVLSQAQGGGPAAADGNNPVQPESGLVKQRLSVQDIRENMLVNLRVTDSQEGKIVEHMTVLAIA